MSWQLSEDGSKVFWVGHEDIKAWSVQTGMDVGKVEKVVSSGFLTVDGLRVWIHDRDPKSEYYDSDKYQGWDFGTPDSSPVQLPNMLPAKLYLNSTKLWNTNLSKIKDTVTGKTVFQLSGRFANPDYVQCDGCYLAAGYNYGELLILDFNHAFLQ